MLGVVLLLVMGAPVPAQTTDSQRAQLDAANEQLRDIIEGSQSPENDEALLRRALVAGGFTLADLGMTEQRLRAYQRRSYLALARESYIAIAIEDSEIPDVHLSLLARYLRKAEASLADIPTTAEKLERFLRRCHMRLAKKYWIELDRTKKDMIRNKLALIEEEMELANTTLIEVINYTPNPPLEDPQGRWYNERLRTSGIKAGWRVEYAYMTENRYYSISIGDAKSGQEKIAINASHRKGDSTHLYSEGTKVPWPPEGSRSILVELIEDYSEGLPPALVSKLKTIMEDKRAQIFRPRPEPTFGYSFGDVAPRRMFTKPGQPGIWWH